MQQEDANYQNRQEKQGNEPCPVAVAAADGAGVVVAARAAAAGCCDTAAGTSCSDDVQLLVMITIRRKVSVPGFGGRLPQG